MVSHRCSIGDGAPSAMRSMSPFAFFAALLLLARCDALSALRRAPSMSASRGVLFFTEETLRLRLNDGVRQISGWSSAVPVCALSPELKEADAEYQAGVLSAVAALQEECRKAGSDLLVTQCNSDGEISDPKFEAAMKALAAEAGGEKIVVMAPTELASGSEVQPRKLMARSGLADLKQGCAEAEYKASDGLLDLCRGADSIQAFRKSLTAAAKVVWKRYDDPSGASLPPLPEGLDTGSWKVGDGAAFGWAPRADAARTLHGFWREDVRDGLDLGEETGDMLLQELFTQGESTFAQRLRAAFGRGSEVGAADADAAIVRRLADATGPIGALGNGEATFRTIGPYLKVGAVSLLQLLSARRESRTLSAERPARPAEVELATRRLWHLHLKNGGSASATMAALAPGTFSTFKVRWTEWNGALVRYAHSADRSGEKGKKPALLLVHGFGASLDQWRHQFDALGGRYDVFALDLPGFGQSEKPALSYHQYYWRDAVVDFARHVLPRHRPEGAPPPVLVGNSIGGFVALAAAAELREEASAVVLVNSAGRVLSPADAEEERASRGGLSVEEWTKRGLCPEVSLPLPPALLQVVSTGLLWGLQPQVKSICRNLYTERPESADDRQVRNIMRDSRDPGAIDVFVAGAKLPPPAPANELFQAFGGPALVLQGMKDPLNDARTRADGFVAAGKKGQVTLSPLEGSGHCPHHEVPDKFCEQLEDFLDALGERKGTGAGVGGGKISG